MIKLEKAPKALAYLISNTTARVSIQVTEIHSDPEFRSTLPKL